MEETRLRCENARLQEELNRIEALEQLLEVKEVTISDMDAMSLEGFQEFREIRKKALRDAGMGGSDEKVYCCYAALGFSITFWMLP